MSVIEKSTLPNLIYRGKVRDTHDVGDDVLLMVATDRISAYDVVLPTAIPEKGAILSKLSEFWFKKIEHIVPNHLLTTDALCKVLDSFKNEVADIGEIAKRAMLVKRAERIDVECIVRGYITGSAWSDYSKTGTVFGSEIKEKLIKGDKFPQPIFTPTTKEEVGHDESITIDEMKNMIGEDLTNTLEEISLSIYNFAHDFALSKGIIIAETKLEFGFINGELSIIDELLTPDSSRFWDLAEYAPGIEVPNFDKQFVRDWLDNEGWDHSPPAPTLPDDVVNSTVRRYKEAQEKLMGVSDE